jgi:MFS transporter, FHS family, L-fucose permease
VSKVQSSGLQAAYFGAYFVSPMLFSVYVLRRWGYKYTFMLGLTIYGVGAILFWPCAKYRTFAGFCVCTFVIGLGLGTLEVSANPYLLIARLLVDGLDILLPVGRWNIRIFD